MTYPEYIGLLGSEYLIADVSARFYPVVGGWEWVSLDRSEEEIEGEG